MGGLGGLFGGLSALAKVGKVAQFIGGAAADLAIGVAWDMAVHKQTPSEALFGNLISFGIGFGIGRGISGAGRLAGRNADNVNVRGGNATNLEQRQVDIFAFRGTGFKDVQYKNENGLIRAGHIGVSTDGGKTIYGFHPSPREIQRL